MATDRITFFKSYFDGVPEMDDAERLEFYEGAFRFAFYDELPEFSTPLQRAAWNFMFPTLESGIAKQSAGRKGGTTKSTAQSKQKSTAQSKQKSSEKSSPRSRKNSTASETEGESGTEREKNLPLEEDSFPRSSGGADADRSAPPSPQDDSKVPVCPLCSKPVRFDAREMSWRCEMCGPIKEPEFREVAA